MAADQLYNLHTLVHTLAPAMLGIPPGGGTWKSSKFRVGAPVVEIVGDHATGKTTALNALYEGFHRHMPTAHVDLADARYSAHDPLDRERLDTVNASPITDLLFTISYQLNQQPDEGRALSFPRLSPALLLITAWNLEPPEPGSPTRPAELAEAEREVRRILSEQKPDPKIQRAVLGRWLKAVAGVVAGLLPGVPGLQAVLAAAIETLLERKPGAPELMWWRTRLSGMNGDAVQRLFQLVERFRIGGPDREWAEAQLIAALLADIDAAHGRWARATRHPPLILFDNIDDALRKRLLGPLVEEYPMIARRHGGAGRAMRPVVFATSLGNGSNSALTPVTNEAPWNDPKLRPPASWLLRLGIPPVTTTEVRAVLGGVGNAQGMPDVILRLGGGRTGNALLLAEAVRSGSRGSNGSGPGWLLSLPSPEPASDDGSAQDVAERLLERLLPDPDVREQLIDLAPALDKNAATKLWGSLRWDTAGLGPALAVKGLIDDILARDHWFHRPWRTAYGEAPLITDRALRALLLHRLRIQGGRERWTLIHRRLASQYNAGMTRPPDSVEHEPRYLHHALALGQLDSLVVRAMHRRYLNLAPASWLDDVNLIAAAPPAFDGFTPEPASADLPPCPGCAQEASGQTIHAAIRKLLIAVWRVSDLESAPPDKHGHPDMVRVRTALETLCADYDERYPHGGHYNAYEDAAVKRGWVDAMLAGVQAPDLPVRKESAR